MLLFIKMTAIEEACLSIGRKFSGSTITLMRNNIRDKDLLVAGANLSVILA